MKRRGRILVVLAAVALAVLLWTVSRPSDDEPSYDGKTLTEWLVAYKFYPGDEAMSRRATNALHHIGTNALPLLVEWLGYEWTAKNDRFLRSTSGLAEQFGGSRCMLMVMGKRMVRHHVAPSGFKILGPEAAAAVPALTNLFCDWTYMSRSHKLIYALSFVGEAGLAPLVTVVTNRSFPIIYRRRAAERIAFIPGIGTNANWAVPVLIASLDDQVVAAYAAEALGDLRLRPELVVPALTSCLCSTNGLLAARAAEALEQFGQDARPAVPELVKLLSQRPFPASAASNALKNIAPEVLNKEAH